MRRRHQYRILQTAFVFALIGIAFFGAYSGAPLTRERQSHKEETLPVRQSQNARSDDLSTVESDKQQRSENPNHRWYDTFLEHLPDWFVAFFTLLLVFVTHRLVTSTNKLWEAGERQIAAAEKSAEAAKQSAHAAERSLTHLERPYIFLFNISMIEQDSDDDFYVKFTVANYGKTPAHIETVRIGVMPTINGIIDLPPEVFESHDLIVSPVLSAGEQRPPIREYINSMFYKETELIYTSADGDSRPIPVFNDSPRETVYLQIVITYRGPLTTGHATSALWMYQGRGRFVARGDSTFNYQH